jgi:hypothetical protein
VIRRTLSQDRGRETHREGGSKRIRRRARLGLLATGVALALAGTAAAAFVNLPADGSQVNNDIANGIDPAQDAGVSDVQGGTVVAGNLQVPWATFEQKTGSSQQIFVRAFKGGQWVTQGFPASLNLDPTVEAEAPSIDFAGTARTVPWVSWYEPNANLGSATQIFASRFSAASNVWLPAGQDRAPGHAVPSLNINTNRDAENPAVVGGAAVAGNDPVPWVGWQELDGAAAGTNQIFVSRAVKSTNGAPCIGKPASGNPSVNGFCWLQVGLDRLNSTTGASSATGDPTLSVDPTRNAIEPDDAFTGPSDTVPWVVWYEQSPGLNGIGNELVFAAKAVPDATADGGFHWVAVGKGTAGQTNVLNTAGTNGFGSCATSAGQERACSLNNDASVDAEDPRVAAGSLVPGGATVPWVTWSETIGANRHAIFVSRLVGGDHFETFNQGQPISNTLNDATRPDITFSGNTPYITWQEDVGGQRRTFTGHFEGGAAAPVFKLDTPTGIARSSTADLRPPVSSTCTANPSNADGATCQAGASGTPFFLFSDGAPGSQHLFANAYHPSDIATGSADAVSTGGATISGSVNPGGARMKVHFEFGTSTAYGTSTPDQSIAVGSAPVSFNAALAGLPAGTKIHYRAVASSDFASIPGVDQTFTTTAAAPPPPPGNVPPKATIVNVPRIVSLHRLGKGKLLRLRLGVSEPAKVAIQLVTKQKKVVRSLTISRAKAGRFTALLSLKHLATRTYTLRVSAKDATGARSLVVSRSLKVVR